MNVVIMSRPMRSILFSALTLGALASVCLAQDRANPPTQPFEIPAVAQAPGCPPEGWCGEASLQMIFMYYGAYIPQKIINAAGHPEHPDLWSNNLGPAMQNLGFKWSDFSTGDTDEYIRKLRASLADGVPVLMGVNVYSNGNGGAHFCVAAKSDDTALTINTTWAMRGDIYTWARLHTKAGGITLADAFQALAIPAPDLLAKHRLRLYPVDPAKFYEKRCKLRIAASNLIKGAKYQIRSYPSMQSADVNRGAGELVDEFTAASPEYTKDVEVDRDAETVFVMTRSHATGS